MSRKRPGRPKGSKNAAGEGWVEPSRCPNCGSSERTPYENPVRVDFPGGGLNCIAKIYRTCHCRHCGQARRDQEPVYAPKGIALGDSNTPSTPPRLAPNSEVPP
jgi:hypothetical protein